MKARRTVAAAALALALAWMAASGAIASSSPAAGVLELSASFTMKYQFGDEYCPPEVRSAQCVRFTGRALVPGLGPTTIQYDKIVVISDADCPVTQFNTAILAVAGKGDLRLTRQGKACGPTAPAGVGPLSYDVTGGTGLFAGASGQLRFNSQVNRIDSSCQCGVASDRWNGSLTVPGAEFDTSAPSLQGARPKTVRVPKTAKRVVVRFSVTAQDEVDGQVPVTCSPASGSRFGLGRTTVTCSANDAAGNTTTSRFTVTVKRRTP